MRVYYAIASIFISAISHAQTASVSEHFEKAFHSASIYNENKCHENVARFIKLLKQKKFDLSNMSAVEIENTGGFAFGMVSAFRARGTLSGEANWFHHVVFYDGEKIYDFDFTQSPQPISPKQYFHEMFKNAKMKSDPEYCQKVLGKYKVTLRSPGFYLNRYFREPMRAEDLMPIQESLLKDLPEWGCSL